MYDDVQTGKMLSRTAHRIPVKAVFERVHIDFVGPLPITIRGNRYILNMVDALSGWVESVATQDKSAATVAKALFTNIFCRYGPPDVLLPDQGTEFVNTIVEELCNMGDVAKHMTSGYHPQTNGKVEKENHILISLLRKYCDEHLDNWDIYLPLAVLADRTRPRAATGLSPMFLVNGREHISFSYINNNRNTLKHEDINEEHDISDRYMFMKHLVEVVHPAVSAALFENEELEKHVAGRQYGVGDYVQIKTIEPTKLGRRYTGLYQINKVTSLGNCALTPIIGKPFPTPLHPLRLRLVGAQLAQKMMTTERSDEDMATGDVVLEVLAHRMNNGAIEYMLGWKTSRPTWNAEVSLIPFDTMTKYWKAPVLYSPTTASYEVFKKLDMPLGTLVGARLASVITPIALPVTPIASPVTPIAPTLTIAVDRTVKSGSCIDTVSTGATHSTTKTCVLNGIGGVDRGDMKNITQAHDTVMASSTTVPDAHNKRYNTREHKKMQWKK